MNSIVREFHSRRKQGRDVLRKDVYDLWQLCVFDDGKSVRMTKKGIAERLSVATAEIENLLFG